MTLSLKLIICIGTGTGRMASLAKPPIEQQHLFLVRIWQEPGPADGSRWRGSVEHVPSGQRLYFSSLRDLNDFIILRSGMRFTDAEVDDIHPIGPPEAG